jgi:hypothetical protein
MSSQQISGAVGQVIGSAESYHVHNHWAAPEPPDDPAMSRQCPQCERLTWRYTTECIHCRLDLAAWDRQRSGFRGWLRSLIGAR